MDLMAYMLASGDDDSSLKLWFWLIVGVFFLIKNIFASLLKSKEKEEELFVPDTEEHHEKTVGKAIERTRRTQPQPRRVLPARPVTPARVPPPPVSPVELPNPAIPRAHRFVPTPEWGETSEQAAEQHLQERYVRATEEARQSINSLSDAELAALQRLKDKEMGKKRSASLPATTESPLPLRNSLRHSTSLKTAILYQELLGKPRALRGTSFSGE